MITPVLVIALAALSAHSGVPAPSEAIRGTITDQQGAVVRNARVEIRCGAERRQTTTDASGDFVEPGLPVGPCTVIASAPLFERAEMSIDLVAGETLVTTIALNVSSFAAEIVVTPRRGVEEEAFGVPAGVSVVSRRDIETRPGTLLAHALREEPGIVVQQTTTGQVSPIIRGFTGQSNVYLLDGVRLNAASWRSGPSQYLSWIDASVADRLEIIRGPGSVQYGSDALGGTINVLPATPALRSVPRVGGEVSVDYGSADRSSGAQVHVQAEGRFAAVRAGGNTRRVGDLRAGGGRDSHAAVTRFLGLPSSGARMPDTGFTQRGGYFLGTFRARSTANVTTLYVHEAQAGVSRYDRLAGGEGLYRSGFDPQVLDFALVKYRQQSSGIFDEWSGGVSYNRQSDGRFEQVRPTTVLDRQLGVTRVFGYQLEGRRRYGTRHHVGIGTEFYDESISGSRELVNPLTNVSVPNRPDIPDGTDYSSLGVFAQQSSEFLGGRLSARAGVRYSRFTFGTTANPSLGVIAEREAVQAVTFNAGAVVALTPQLNATFSLGRGFRAPNAADFGSIGLTGGSGFEITPSRAAGLGGIVGSTVGTGATSTGIAVPSLGPEVLYAIEAGLKFRTNRASGSVVGYDLEYLDAIQRRAVVFGAGIVGTSISGYQVTGQDEAGLAYIAQDIRPIATRVNLDHARILGIDAEADVMLSARWSARTALSMSGGHLLSTGEYLRRMPPPLGTAALRWSGGRFWAEGVVSFSFTQARFNSGDLSDARIGGVRTTGSIAGFFNGPAVDKGLVANGTLKQTGETLAQVQSRVLGAASTSYLFTEAPGFVVYGARFGWRVSGLTELTVIGENLADRNYRSIGSGVDAPGINLQVRIRQRF